MITAISISNFKSLNDFKLEGISGFVCLIGLNGSGKTTLLQAFDFIGHLVSGDIREWMDNRGWKPGELVTHGEKKRTITFSVKVKVSGGKELRWDAVYNVDKYLCTSEKIYEGDTKILDKDSIEPPQSSRDGVVIGRVQSCSILSAYVFVEPVKEMVEILKELKSLELLSPAMLRHSSRPVNDIGLGGEYLAGYLYNLKSGDHFESLLEDLKNFYPSINDFSLLSKRSGWKTLWFDEKNCHCSASHINDGTLRVLSILSQKYSQHKILLFDEIENGINQEIVSALVKALTDFKNKQVIITTHSALLLNYM